MRFIVIDDSKVFATLFQHILEEQGHEVMVETDSLEAMASCLEYEPDCILLDLMMPGVDGFTLLKEFRQNPATRDTLIIIVSAKPYDADRNRAMQLGASGFINKTAERDNLLERINEIVGDRLRIHFWGVRGTLPVPGEQSLRYGGNTSCVTVNFPDGRMFIFDAGSGIKALANHIMANQKTPLKASLFISHPHWDHINALPFFTPLYIKSNEFQILGPAHEDRGIADLISAQMDGVFFPITVSEFAAHVEYRDLQEGEFDVSGIKVRTLLLNHPGQCLGYRVEYDDRVICYVTDNELYPEDTEFFNAEYQAQLAEFIGSADIVIIDSTYTDEEYRPKIHWGHSPISEVIKVAHMGKVKKLCLFHHDPDQNDKAIDAKLATAQQMLRDLKSATECVAPAEGSELLL